MFTAYLAVGILTAAANGAFATLAFMRSEFVLQNMARVRVNPSWLYPLGFLKMAGAVGLLIGIAVPPLGVAAAIGLVLFFIGAIVAHLRVHDYSSIPFPGSFLLLAVASLAFRLGSA